MLAKATSCLGGTTQSLAFTQVVDSIIKQEKQVQQSVLEDDVAMAKAHQSRFMAIQKERLETVMQLFKLVAIKFFVAPAMGRLSKWASRGAIPRQGGFLSRKGNRLKVNLMKHFRHMQTLPLLAFMNTDQLFEFYRLGFYLSRALLIEHESELKFSREHRRATKQESRRVVNAPNERRFRLFDIEHQLIKLKFEKAYAKSMTESLNDIQANWSQFSAIFQANFILKPINNLRQSLKDLSRPSVYEAFGSSRMQDILHSKGSLMDSLSDLHKSLVQPIDKKDYINLSFQNLLRVPQLVTTSFLDPRSHAKRALSHRISLTKADLVYGFHLQAKLDSLIKHLETQKSSYTCKKEEGVK